MRSTLVALIASCSACAQGPAQPQPQPELVLQSSHSAIVWGMSFSPDSHWLASSARDNTVKLWDTRTGELSRTLIVPELIREGAITADNRFIVGQGASGVYRWELETGVALPVVAATTFAPQVLLDRSGTLLTYRSGEREVSQIPVSAPSDRGKVIATVPAPSSGMLRVSNATGSTLLEIASTPDGSRVAGIVAGTIRTPLIDLPYS